jgi:hypothetical protein
LAKLIKVTLCDFWWAADDDLDFMTLEPLDRIVYRKRGVMKDDFVVIIIFGRRLMRNYAELARPDRNGWAAEA